MTDPDRIAQLANELKGMSSPERQARAAELPPEDAEAVAQLMGQRKAHKREEMEATAEEEDRDKAAADRAIHGLADSLEAMPESARPAEEAKMPPHIREAVARVMQRRKAEGGE